MYGIIGEDPSDVATLKVMVRRLASDDSLRVKTKGYCGSGKLLRKGARQLDLFATLRCTRFVICHDADGPDPAPNRERVFEKIVRPSGVGADCCVVIPVQELEAWILADIEAVKKLFTSTSWKPREIRNPEKIDSPKEHLEKLSRTGNCRPRYAHAVHNEKMAKYLDLDKVRQKCPSFQPLVDFVAR